MLVNRITWPIKPGAHFPLSEYSGHNSPYMWTLTQEYVLHMNQK